MKADKRRYRSISYTIIVLFLFSAFFTEASQLQDKQFVYWGSRKYLYSDLEKAVMNNDITAYFQEQGVTGKDLEEVRVYINQYLEAFRKEEIRMNVDGTFSITNPTLLGTGKTVKRNFFGKITGDKRSLALGYFSALFKILHEYTPPSVNNQKQYNQEYHSPQSQIKESALNYMNKAIDAVDTENFSSAKVYLDVSFSEGFPPGAAKILVEIKIKEIQEETSLLSINNKSFFVILLCDKLLPIEKRKSNREDLFAYRGFCRYILGDERYTDDLNQGGAKGINLRTLLIK